MLPRAGAPDGLVKAQQTHWDPVLAWARTALGAPLFLAEGVAHVAQPETSLARLRETLLGRDAFSLAALHVMTALTGSALLALAVAQGRLTPEAAWEAAHVDEDWQISKWGEDAEAAERRKNRWRDFAAATRALALTQDRVPSRRRLKAAAASLADCTGFRQLAGTLALSAASRLGSGPIFRARGLPWRVPVRTKRSRISSGVAGGKPQALRTPWMTSTVPATIGVALDVPLNDLV